MQKIWICGAGGRVGRKLTRILSAQPVELLLTDMDSVDITDSDGVMEYAHINRPHYMVNCAGLTDVGACEADPERAYKVNALGARNLSVAARMGKARLVQMSTDDVFDGKSHMPYTEFDAALPGTIYGKSKLAGENFVREFCSRHIIIRSSWIFGDGSPYLRQILEQASQGRPVRAASDQMASPTGADDLAAKVIELMEHGEDGLYHVTGQGCCTRYELAREVIRLSGFHVPVEPVPASEDTLSSMRPSYSVLDNMMLRISGMELLPRWEEMLEAYMARWKAGGKDGREAGGKAGGKLSEKAGARASSNRTPGGKAGPGYGE